MIIKKITEINLKQFIAENKNEPIIIRNNIGTNNFPMMKKVLDTCESVNEFLSIEIGEDFFFIERVQMKGCSGCPYCLSNRTIDEIVKEECC